MRKKRSFVIISYCLCAALLLSGSNWFAGGVVSGNTGDEFAQLRQRWRTVLTGGGSYDPQDTYAQAKITAITAAANKWWGQMQKPVATHLWSDLADNTLSRNLTTAYQRLYEMALAYATRGSSLEGNQALLTDLKTGIDWMYDHRYNENIEKYGADWDWWCGAGVAIGDLVLLLYDELSPEQIDEYKRAVTKRFYRAGSGSSGMNLLWGIRVVAVRSIITADGGNDKGMGNARDSFSLLFKYTPDQNLGLNNENADGFYTDGSFIQHFAVPYTAGYGAELLKDLAPLLSLFAGSSWDITDPQRENIWSWVYDTYEPMMYKGIAMDMFAGRYIARVANPDHYNGNRVTMGLLSLAQFAPENHAGYIKSMAKAFIQDNPTYYDDASLYSLALAKSVMDDPSVARPRELTANRQLPMSARAVHRAEGFAFGISMANEKIKRYECLGGATGAGENLKGWYTGAGATYLYNNDIRQFAEHYWPTVNPYRLPGTTVDTITRTNNSATGVSSQNLVGGTSDGKNGVTGMVVADGVSKLSAKKSWFMFDDEVVALGAGISNADQSGNGWDGQPRRVETVVENRKLNSAGNNSFVVNGESKSPSLGWSETMSPVSWAHLSGSTAGSDIGYYFPSPASVKGLRENRKGTWTDINISFPNGTQRSNNYLTMTLDHGTNPVNGSYAYVLLPNKTSGQVGQYASNPDISILENSEQVHAVKEKKLGTVGAFFWNDAVAWVKEEEAYLFSANRKAAVMTNETESVLEISVSDPTRAGNGAIKIEVAKNAVKKIETSPGVTVNSLKPIKLTVDVSGSYGKTFTARFDLDGSAPVAPPPPAPTPETVILYPTEDTYVSNLIPDSPKGGEKTLCTGKSNSALYASYNLPDGMCVESILMKFDLSSIQDRILSAKVYGHIQNWVRAPGYIYPMPDHWSEATVTLNNMPAHDPIPASVLEWPYKSAWTTVELGDITDYIQSERTGDGVASMLLQSTAVKPGDKNVLFMNSKEADNIPRRPYPELITIKGGLTVDEPALTIGGRNITFDGLENGTVTAGIHIENGSAASMSAVMAMALYEGEKLEKISFSPPADLPRYTGSGTLVASIDIANLTQAHLLKIFVWESDEKLKPLISRGPYIFNYEGMIQ